MSFGRQKNLIRRAVRPDLNYHRARRRKSLNHIMLSTAGMWLLRAVLRRLLGRR